MKVMYYCTLVVMQCYLLPFNTFVQIGNFLYMCVYYLNTKYRHPTRSLIFHKFDEIFTSDLYEQWINGKSPWIHTSNS